MWNDLREANDPEAPASVPGHVQFQPPPRSTSGNVILDPNSLSSAARAAVAATAHRGHASNELMVSAARSATHHPIMVAGPQIGYYYPGFTTEVVVHAPGVDQRGVTTVPFPGYIFIGRSQDQSWSLTSAGLNQIDTYVETLCGGSIHKYLYNGKLPADAVLRRRQAHEQGVTSEVTFYRTVHGPVFGYARVHGRPRGAIARSARATARTCVDQLFYHDLGHGLVHNVRQFFTAANRRRRRSTRSTWTTRTSACSPAACSRFVRPTSIPDLPINGTGQARSGAAIVSFKNHPQGVNPPKRRDRQLEQPSSGRLPGA